jgi:hypothetical protein
MPTRPYLADDFDNIRARMNELRGNREKASAANVDVVYFQNRRTVVFRCLTDGPRNYWDRLIDSATGIARGTIDGDFSDALTSKGYTSRRVNSEDEV